MSSLRVWAPLANKVEVDLAGERSAMTPAADGWWHVSRSAEPGQDYAFVLDGGRPLPDPRSPWQPNGVHGPSRTLDHDAFGWTDQRWQPGPLSSAVIYELHVGTFTPEGSFDAIIGKLDHLVELGVTHVELMPVNQYSGSRGWGYDGVDLFAPHQAYGGPEGLKRLVEACHTRGLAVLLDVVYNHLGPAGNYLGQFGPYFSKRHSTPWGEAINFDGPGSYEVRRFFCDNALMWLRDYHIDGLRIDAIHAIVDTSAIHILEQLAEEADDLEAHLGRHLTLIAESDLNDPRAIRAKEAGGYGIDAQWSDDFHHALHTVLTGEQAGYYGDFGSMSHLAKALKQGFVYDGRFSQYRRRTHGAPPTGLKGERFLAFLQNHDQVGNRAQGERSSHLMSSQRLKAAAVLVLTAPFVPMIFQGEEWAASSPFLYFTDHEDEELGRAVTKGRREEFAAFGWDPSEVPDPQIEQTFLHSKINWSEAGTEPHAELLAWHRELIRLRKRLPWLTDGRLEGLEVRYDDKARWLTFDRGPVIVACNLGERPRNVARLNRATLKVLLASHAEVEVTESEIRLPPDSAVILADEEALKAEGLG